MKEPPLGFLCGLLTPFLVIGLRGFIVRFFGMYIDHQDNLFQIKVLSQIFLSVIKPRWQSYVLRGHKRDMIF
jgi:hypothetical protein